MHLTFRWYGPEDPISLEQIRQIPGITGIVSGLYDLAPGELWPAERVNDLQDTVRNADLSLEVIESIPVHESIKLGRSDRDQYIDRYRDSVRHLGQAGIPVLCYNFMPIFDWTRTDLSWQLADGSFSLRYDHQDFEQIDLSEGLDGLPGWGGVYDADELRGLLAEYRSVDAEQLWANLQYFLEAVVPVAEDVGVRMAIHPDDPPWEIAGLPRIITTAASLQRVIHLVDSPANGLAFCTGSLGARADNDLPAMIRRFGGANRIHFVHVRNLAREGGRSFHETAHPTASGDLDMFAIVEALHDVAYDGPLRPDHGRMIWGEAGRPGYGLYDRALGASYLQGLWEAVGRQAMLPN